MSEYEIRINLFTSASPRPCVENLAFYPQMNYCCNYATHY